VRFIAGSLLAANLSARLNKSLSLKFEFQFWRFRQTAKFLSDNFSDKFGTLFVDS
jgi:hypothetical protein